MPTEMLKLVMEFSSVLQVMNSSISGMVDAQHRHVGAAPAAALGHLTEGFIIDAQETHRTGGLTGGGFDQRVLRAQAGEGKAIAAAGLLDQGRIAQRLEDARRVAPHIIGDGQHKAGSQLAQRRTSPGKGR